MSENDSQRPQDVGNAGETQQQPRVQVESTPADGNNIPYVQAYDTQTGKPLGGQQVVNKHTVVKTKTKKLPIFITALAGCACGALLVIALIMSGTLDIGGGKNAVTAGASGSSTQKITIVTSTTKGPGRMARFRSLPTSRTTRAASVRAWCSIPRATSSPTTTWSMAMTSTW